MNSTENIQAESFGNELAEDLALLEHKAAIARSRIDSEVLIDRGTQLARNAAFKYDDVSATLRAMRVVETQYRSRWGATLGESYLRARRAMHDIKPWLMDARTSLLDEFSADPNQDTVWERAYEWVRAEADYPAYWIKGTEKRRPTIADDIPGEELIALADQVRQARPEERYALMIQQAPTGETWFDVLQSFSSPQIEAAEEKVIEDVLGDTVAEVALDIGTGTGKSLDKLKKHALKVIGLDRNIRLLERTKTDEEVLPAQAEVEHLPLKDESVDLASSTGLAGALDRGAAIAFYREIARVLKPGGLYVDGVYYFDQDGYAGEELSRIVATSKAMLADMIVDTVSGKFELNDRLDDEDRAQLLGKLGLEERVQLVAAETSSLVKSRVTLITKR